MFIMGTNRDTRLHCLLAEEVVHAYSSASFPVCQEVLEVFVQHSKRRADCVSEACCSPYELSVEKDIMCKKPLDAK